MFYEILGEVTIFTRILVTEAKQVSETLVLS
jgi:hypothetical protein